MNSAIDTTDASLPATAGAPRAGALGRQWSRVLGRVLSLSPRETKVTTRGFTIESPDMVDRIEGIGATFALGYNAAVRSADLDALIPVLANVPVAECGFAFEGAGMGLAVADFLSPGRRLFEAYVAGPANHHEYIAWVGFGWSFARLPVSPARVLARHGSINRWLALDGYGFHEGYFAWPKSVSQHRRPRSLGIDEARVFDQGLGRSLWFVFGANGGRIAEAIAAFDPSRHNDLWAGVGLAAAYAGGVGEDQLRQFVRGAGIHASAFAQGVAFAAEARRRADNPAASAALACEVVLGLSLVDAADIATRCVPPAANDIRAYQRWRTDIQAECASRMSGPVPVSKATPEVTQPC